MKLDPETKWAVIDLETMSRRVDAAIVQIGAVSSVGDTFECNVQLESQDGRHIEPSTVLWWVSQAAGEGQEAARSWLEEPRVDLKAALESLSRWWKRHELTHLWGHRWFDPGMLSDAYASFGLETPWRYSNVLDLRTLHALFPSERGKPEHMHNALRDAGFHAGRVEDSLEQYRKRTAMEDGEALVRAIDADLSANPATRGLPLFEVRQVLRNNLMV